MKLSALIEELKQEENERLIKGSRIVRDMASGNECSHQLTYDCVRNTASLERVQAILIDLATIDSENVQRGRAQLLDIVQGLEREALERGARKHIFDKQFGVNSSPTFREFCEFARTNTLLEKVHVLLFDLKSVTEF